MASTRRLLLAAALWAVSGLWAPVAARADVPVVAAASDRKSVV